MDGGGLTTPLVLRLCKNISLRTPSRSIYERKIIGARAGARDGRGVTCLRNMITPRILSRLNRKADNKRGTRQLRAASALNIYIYISKICHILDQAQAARKNNEPAGQTAFASFVYLNITN